MEKEKLYQYFAGTLDAEGIKEIKSWAEQSEENAKILLRERRIYDAITLLPSGRTAARQQLPRRTSRRVFASVATLLLLVLISGGTRLLFKRNHAGRDTAREVITVPAGQRVHIRLADGTTVWLNAATTLTYSPEMRGKKREVFLDGQAFFDVHKDEDRPFIVHTFALDIQVHGTQFDVCAYSKRGIFEAALMSGSISAYPGSDPSRHVMLKPNQRIYLHNGIYKTTRIDDPDFYRWKEGIYCFRDKPLSALLEDLERYYDCVFTYEPTPALENETITGKLRISDGIDQALSVLQHSLHFSYLKEKDSNHIYITAKP